MVRNGRTENRTKIAASGFAENYVELEQLFDTVIDEMDENEKLDDSWKDQEKKKKYWSKQEENFRRLVTKRKTDGDGDVVEEASTKKSRKKPIVDLKSEFDSDLKVLAEQDKLRQQNDAKRLQLEERRLFLQEN